VALSIAPSFLLETPSQSKKPRGSRGFLLRCERTPILRARGIFVAQKCFRYAIVIAKLRDRDR